MAPRRRAYTGPMDDPRAPSGQPDERPAIRLDDVLKLAGLAGTGGHAKRLIQAGEVRVNGVVETRRKHLLHQGDEVEVGGETFVVELSDEPPDDGPAGDGAPGAADDSDRQDDEADAIDEGDR